MAFIIIQFTSEFNSLYNDVIKPTIENFDIECIRGDDIYNSIDIEQNIREVFSLFQILHKIIKMHSRKSNMYMLLKKNLFY